MDLFRAGGRVVGGINREEAVLVRNVPDAFSWPLAQAVQAHPQFAGGVIVYAGCHPTDPSQMGKVDDVDDSDEPPVNAAGLGGQCPLYTSSKCFLQRVLSSRRDVSHLILLSDDAHEIIKAVLIIRHANLLRPPGATSVKLVVFIDRWVASEEEHVEALSAVFEPETAVVVLNA